MNRRSREGPSLARRAMCTQSSSTIDEQRLQVPIVQVPRDVLRDRRLARFQKVEIAIAHHGRDLVADVNQLPQGRVERRALRIMPQGRDELGGRPTIDRGRARQFRGVDVDDGGIRRAQGVALLDRLRVDLLGDHEPVAARLGQTDDLLKPGRARRLEMQPGAELRDRPSNRGVDRELVAAGVDAQLQIRRQAVAADRRRR